MAQAQVQVPRNQIVDIADIIGKLAPIFLDKTTTTTGNISAEAAAQSDAAFNLAFNRAQSSDQADRLIEDILYRAQLAFAPVLGEEKAAGVYNSSTKLLLGQEAQRRAAAAAGAAVLQDQQQNLATAASVANQRTQATRGTTQTAQRQANPLLGLGALFALGGGQKLLKKPPTSKTLPPPASSGAEAVEPGAYDYTQEGYSSFETGNISAPPILGAGNLEEAAGAGFFADSISGGDLAEFTAADAFGIYDYGFDGADLGVASDIGFSEAGSELASLPAGEEELGFFEDIFDIGGGDGGFFEDVGGFFGFADGGQIPKINPLAAYTDAALISRSRPVNKSSPLLSRLASSTTTASAVGAPTRQRKPTSEDEEGDARIGGDSSSVGTSASSTGPGGPGSGRAAMTAIAAMASMAAMGLPGLLGFGKNLGAYELGKNVISNLQETQSLEQAQTELADFMAAFSQAMAEPGFGLSPGLEPQGFDYSFDAIDQEPGTAEASESSTEAESSEADASSGAEDSDSSGSGEGEGDDGSDGDEGGGDFYDGGVVLKKKGKKDGYAEGGRVSREEDYIKQVTKSPNTLGSPSIIDELLNALFKSPIDRRGADFGIPPANVKTSAVDSVPINVTPGEYVLPVDVVNVIGKDKLDALVDSLHQPVQGGRVT